MQSKFFKVEKHLEKLIFLADNFLLWTPPYFIEGHLIPETKRGTEVEQTSSLFEERFNSLKDKI